MSVTMIVAVVGMSLCVLGAWPRVLDEEPSGFGRISAIVGAAVALGSLLLPWYEYRIDDGPLRFVQAPDPWILLPVLLILAAAAMVSASARQHLVPAGLVGAMAWLALGLTSVVLQGDVGRTDTGFRAGIGAAVIGLTIISIGAGYLGITRLSRSVDRERGIGPS